MLQRRDVLGQTAAAKANARLEVVPADALVEGGPPGDEINVDAKPFAEARDLVDERHLGSEESVRNVLDHFRRTQVRDNHGAVDSLVKGCYARRGSLVFSAHDNSVRVEKVMHAASFAEE